MKQFFLALYNFDFCLRAQESSKTGQKTDFCNVSIITWVFSAVLVTAVAFVEGRFVEVDAVHMTKELLVLPRGHQHTVSQLDYFCSTISASSKPGMYDLWQYGLSSFEGRNTKYYRVLAKIDLLQGSYCTLWIDRVESSKIGYYYRKIKCFKIIVIKIVNKKVCSYWMILFDFVSLSSKIENPYCHNICNHNVHLFHMFDLLIDHDLERDAVRYY